MATKKLFKLSAFKSLDVVVYDMDLMENGQKIHDELKLMTGQRTVPSVFVNGQHLGGNDDIQNAYRTGELNSLLSQSAQ